MFRVGQKVVCIDDKFVDPRWRHVPNRPVQNGVYTIRALFIERFGDGPEPAMHLEEVVNRPDTWVGWPELHEFGFPTNRFRPVVERKSETDISIFTKILDDVRYKSPARVD